MRSVLLARAFRDLRLAPGRTLALALAVLVGGVAVGTTLGAYGVLSREITRSYAETAPASATIELDRVTPEALALARARPEVRAAEARATTLLRIDAPDGSRRLLLFTVPDFDAMALSRFTPERGAWPPGEGEILLERSSLRVVDAGIGDALPLRSGSRVRTVRIAGLVHDPGLAPAWMERTAYGYATPATLGQLDGEAVLDELRVVFADAETASVERIDGETAALAGALAASGRVVREIDVPPPRRHPHQGQMQSILLLLSMFGGVTLLLAGVLVANVVVARIASQTREVGVLQAIGARPGQLVVATLALVGALCAMVALVAVPIARSLALGLAADISTMLNFDLRDASVPAWVPVLVVLATTLVPLAVAAVPIARAARVPVRLALDASAGASAFGAAAVERLVARVRLAGSAGTLAVRNAMRRRAWLVASVLQLAIGGATFVAALGISDGWDVWAREVEVRRHYDVEVAVPDAAARDAALAALAEMPAVHAVEVWGDAPLGAGDGVPIERTYPDGGHGSFRATSVPAEMRMVELPLTSGRWLAPDTEGEVVLNELAVARTGAEVGGDVSLAVAGRPARWRVVGVVHDVGSPAAAYVTEPTLARAAGASHRFLLRVSAGGAPPASGAIERALDAASVPVVRIVPREMLRTAIGEHVGILTAALVALAILIALVGAIGVGAATATAIVERARETGILRAIGAPPAFVARTFVLEGVFVGAVSAALGVALAAPLTLALGAFLGRVAFGSPLPFVVSPAGVLAWCAGIAVTTALSSAVPAAWTMRASVRDALGAT